MTIFKFAQRPLGGTSSEYHLELVVTECQDGVHLQMKVDTSMKERIAEKIDAHGI